MKTSTKGNKQQQQTTEGIFTGRTVVLTQQLLYFQNEMILE